LRRGVFWIIPPRAQHLEMRLRWASEVDGQVTPKGSPITPASG
jgi:hypothetical protein